MRRPTRPRWRAPKALQRALFPESVLFLGHLEEDHLAARFPGSLARRGFYVGVGCGDPISLSSALLLYENGWRGINIDASRSVIVNDHGARPRDNRVQALVGLLGLVQSSSYSKTTREPRATG